MTGKRLGATVVVDVEGRVVGPITDGDLRRAIGQGPGILRLSAKQLMTPAPHTLAPDRLASEGPRRLAARKSLISGKPSPSELASFAISKELVLA